MPANSYTFRVDYDGTQYWSDVISIIPHEENNIDLQLELLADLTHDPRPDRFDGMPPVFEPEKIMVASLGSIRGLLVQSVVGQTTGGQEIYYFINDHLGTPQKLLNESADVVWSADYMPFGDADIVANTFENRFRFPGQYFDTETGLHYNYHRYYDPSMGRYLRADPIGLAGGINLYAYANLNPITSIDPLGMWTVGIGLGSTGGAGVGASGSGMIVVDGKGNIGIIASGGAGGFGGVAASAGGIIQVTTADTIYDLRGTSVQTGGSVGEGISIGIELITGKNYMGFNINAGLGGALTLVELHSIAEYAKVSGMNIFDLIDHIRDILEKGQTVSDCQ